MTAVSSPLDLPHGMGTILKHLEDCPIPMLAVIEAEIKRKGINKSETPFAITREYHSHTANGPKADCWHVIIGLDMASVTDDVDVSDPDLNMAIHKALRQLRRLLGR